MYVDESGDTGAVANGSPTKYFALSGVVIHESAWHEALALLIKMRRYIKRIYGVPIREELHSAHMLSGRPSKGMRGLTKHQKLAIIKLFTLTVVHLPRIRVINILVDKSQKSPTADIFEIAWSALLQRFENTMMAGNFPDVIDKTKEFGLLIPDDTDRKKLTQLLRKMRHMNFVPNMRAAFGSGSRNLQIQKIIEDPFYKNSEDSYFIQIADLAAFLLYQKFAPNSYIRKKSSVNLFDTLDPVLLKQATYSNTQGIVKP